MAFAWAALSLLAFLVAVGMAGVGGVTEQLVQFLPELAPTQSALTAIALSFGLCVEALLVATGVLVGYIRADRIFRPSAFGWVNVLVIAVVVATLLAIVALFFIPGPPQLFILVEACVPVGATVTLVLLVMRSLLGRAVAMHVELDEVV
ncbi:MAG TPA: DUF2975 domain-containing protein [Humibacter sp.]|nr:DUF2975 domain-containing protein [Humibacter sp.]